jgi:ABC-type lipoprotein release transport system permease subunit
MLFYIKLAWRNIFRNKRRTIIASIAIGIGLASLIFTGAMMKGMETNMMQSATTSFLGEGQIHGSDFRETQEVEKTVQQLDKVKAALEKEQQLETYAPRTLAMGMVTSPANVNAVLLVGIDKERERALSQIDDALKEGEYFKGDNSRDIIIGSKLAEQLEVALGDRVVVTAAQAHSGELSQEMFRISGIYHFDLKEMDTGFAFIRLPKAQQMLGIGDNVHQLALKFKEIDFSIDETQGFWKKYSLDGNEAVSWVTLLPQMKAISDMSNISIFMLVIILGAVVTFGIINTLFMSLYERMFEFAVLRAVGTRPGGIRKLIFFEAGALAMISIVIGVILGFALTLYGTHTGIDYRGIEFAGTTFRDMLYPEMQLWHFIGFPVGVFFFTMIVGIYPAWVAGRMKIADSLRRSM